MLYHKFMVYRVRSSTRIRGLRLRKRHPLLSLTTLSSLGLCATAIYASIGVWDHSSLGDADRNGIVWEFSSEIAADSDPSFHKVDQLAYVAQAAEKESWPVIDGGSTPWTSPDLAELSESLMDTSDELARQISSPVLVEEALVEEILDDEGFRWIWLKEVCPTMK